MIPLHSDYWQKVFSRSMLICLLTGFMSGFPYYFIFQLLQLWLTDAGLSASEIGLFALVGLPYSWKFLWAPLLDQFFSRKIGRRRSWLIPVQLLLVLLMVALSVLNPAKQLLAVSVLTFVIAWLSATQDIALDAYRREILLDEELGLGNSMHVQAWRLSGFIPGALSFVLADFLPWTAVFFMTAMFFFAGFVACLFLKEPDLVVENKRSIIDMIILPLQNFITRHGFKMMLMILAFMVLYKLGDSMATALSTKFYIDLGFSSAQIGLVAKNAALWPMIIGGIVGGLVMLKIGINKALWIFGAVQLVTILGFAVLSMIGADIWVLSVVIALEYLGVGLGTAAFTAFIARVTSIEFAATQFALLTALAVLPRTIAASVTGFIVDMVGWTEFFFLCTVCAVPGMLMLIWVAPWGTTEEVETNP